MAGAAYTDAEVRRLEVLVTYQTGSQVAVALGRSEASVRKKAQRLGLAFAGASEPMLMPTVHQVGRLTTLGLTSAMIGKAVGRSARSVGQVRQVRGFEAPSRPCHLNVHVTEWCWSRLSEAARHHGHGGDRGVSRVAAVTLECVAANALDVLPVIVPPPPPRTAPVSSLFVCELEARA